MFGAMMKSSVDVFQFFALMCIGTVHAEYKEWLPDTNFGNPANWNAKRTPCGNDVVLIPDHSPVVYMQLNTTIKELILPKDGEIIFSMDTLLQFTSDSSSNADCPDFGGDVEFSASQPVPWLDPSSWCVKSQERDDCDVTAVRLDVEKVPCSFDDVLFPKNHLYYADLSNVMQGTKIKSIKLSGSALSTQTFQEFVNSTEGQGVFRTATLTGSPPLDITRKSCDDPSGCACGNDRPQVSAEICKYAGKACKRPRCRSTIQPVGACCRQCGGVFNITRGYGFNFNDFKQLINDKFFKDKQTGVNMTASIMSEGWVQMVLTDLTGEASIKLGQDIKKEFENDLAQGGHKYAIDGIQFSVENAPPIGPSASGHSGSKLDGGAIAGIVFFVVIAIIVILVLGTVFVYRRQGKPLPKLADLPRLPSMPNIPTMPGLPRFFRRRGNYQEQGRDQVRTAPHVDPGFANPLYNTSPFDDNTVFREMELVDPGQEIQPTFDVKDGGFNNPLYASKRGRGGASIQDATYAEPATGDEGGRASDPQASAKIATDKPAAILIDTTGGDGGNTDSTI